MSTAKKSSKSRRKSDRKPRILVLEGLSGAANCVRRAGAEPITVSPRDLPGVDEVLAQEWDGLLLTGGGDVDPRLYGEKPHQKVYGVSELRDYTEWSALDEAAKRGVPVMGICRGMQLMAVYNGGRLKQHIGGHRGIDHLVYTEPGSRFRRTVRSEAAFFVSLHHQVVLRTGKGWAVGGRDKRGNIESVESRDGRCLGVQFHPEMDYGTNPQSRLLFDWLVGEAAKRAGLVEPSRIPVMRPRRPEGAPPANRQLRLLDTPLVAPPSTIDPTPGKRGSGRGVRTFFICRECGMQFDEQQDRDDHEHWLHGEPTIGVTEPPPGHADWMEA